MFIVQARIEAPDGCDDLPGLRQILWDTATPWERVEHLHLKRHPSGVDVTFFLLQPTLADAEHAAAQICLRMMEQAGKSRWRLTHLHGVDR